MLLRFALLVCSFSFIFGVKLDAQNCGLITNFVADIVNNGNGTSTYTFHITVAATSGGSKSVKSTIRCTNNVFVSNACAASDPTVTTIVNYGPFTVPTCTGAIELLWSGHTNASCGGSTCSAQQSVPLPVELSVFEAKKSGTATVLNWETASEINNDRFIVERSQDGRSFEPIGEVYGHGTTQEVKRYEFLDANPLPGNNYYRLKQLDFDGFYEYTMTKVITVLTEGDIRIFPTLTEGAIEIQFPENYQEETDISVYSLQGNLVYATLSQGNSKEVIHLPAQVKGQLLVVASNRLTTKQVLVFKQ
jgi:hypothetical protein